MKYSLIIFGKFSFFKIAEALHKSNKLNTLYTSYPKFLTLETQLRPIMVSLGFLYIMNRLGHRIFPKGGPNDQLLKMLFSICIYWRLKIFDDNADVYIFLGQNGYYSKLIKLLKKRGRRVVITDGSVHPRTRNQLMEELMKHVNWEPKTKIIPNYIITNYDHELELADLIIAPSNFVSKSLTKEIKGIKERVRIIPFGINLNSKPVLSDISRKDKIIILGVVSGQKGYEFINEAAKHFPNLNFDFVGEVERSVPRRNAQSNVKFLGKIQSKKVQTILSEYDALLIASIQDGFPAVVAQAIAAGLNVLASKNVGSVDICSDGIDLFFEPFEVQPIKDTIDDFYENHHLLRSRAIARASNPLDFSWENFINQLEANLSSVASDV